MGYEIWKKKKYFEIANFFKFLNEEIQEREIQKKTKPQNKIHLL